MILAGAYIEQPDTPTPSVSFSRLLPHAVCLTSGRADKTNRRHATSPEPKQYPTT